MYNINCRNIEMEGLKELVTIFDQNDKLVGIFLYFNKDRYNALINNLDSKYTMVSNNSPVVGDKVAEFKSENTLITVDSPHMSFNMTVRYIHKDFEKLYLEKSKQKLKQKNQKEQESL